MAKGECTIVVLVPHPSRPALLTTAAPTWPPGAVIGLPHVILDREFTTRACLTAIEALLGVQPRALRIDPRRHDADRDPTVVVVDLEAFGPDAPSPYEWADWADLPLYLLQPPELREAVPHWGSVAAGSARPSGSRSVGARLVRSGVELDGRSDGGASRARLRAAADRLPVGHLSCCGRRPQSARCTSSAARRSSIGRPR